MKTFFVNPFTGSRRGKSRRKRARKAARRSPSRRRNPNSHALSYMKGKLDAMNTFSNPRRRRKKARRTTRRRRSHARGPVRRRRRRNAGVTPFVRNPLILRNPRRRRHSNPAMNLQAMAKQLFSVGGGAGLGYAVNRWGVERLGLSFWPRQGVRVAGAAIISVFLPKLLRGQLGSNVACAAAASLLYPTMQDLDARYVSGPAAIAAGAAVAGNLPSASSADLDLLSADLEDVLDEVAAYN
jgi:hypothetical protein